MAQYQHLPIYKQAYDVLLRTMTATKDFPREYKFTLGQKIKDELTELVVMIYRANTAMNKKQHIESILERIQAIQLLMRLCHDMNRPFEHESRLKDLLAQQAELNAALDLDKGERQAAEPAASEPENPNQLPAAGLPTIMPVRRTAPALAP
jgi:hypothetical protein